MPKSRAQFMVDLSLLAEILLLPEGAEIIAIEENFDDKMFGRVRLLVEHPDLPIVSEGCIPKEIGPVCV